MTSTTPHVRSTSAWRELLLAAALSAVAGLIASAIDLGERVHQFTRGWESLQLDELPYALLVFTACLLALYIRRYGQVREALEARRETEQALARALAENRALARRHLLAQEAERKHLARELHDELGQYLNAIKIDAVSLEAGRLAPAEAAAAGTRIVHSVDHVHGELSGMIRRLRPVGLDELGLGAALEHCIDQWRRRLPDVRLELHRRGSLEGLGEDVDLTVYRVVQESLTNASRHGRPRHVEVRLERREAGQGGFLHVTVRDDGVGMSEGAVRDGFGLRGMRERVELLGGRMDVLSAPGEGVTLQVVLPLAGTVE